MGEKDGVCQTCQFWSPYTTLLSIDGLEFQIGHCEPVRLVGDDAFAQTHHFGLTADNYGCSEHMPETTITQEEKRRQMKDYIERNR